MRGFLFLATKKVQFKFAKCRLKKFIKYTSNILPIQTDTRKLKKDDLFFALKGPNFNGNLFARQALEKGAAYVFTDEEISVKDDRIIKYSKRLKHYNSLQNFTGKQV